MNKNELEGFVNETGEAVLVVSNKPRMEIPKINIKDIIDVVYKKREVFCRKILPLSLGVFTIIAGTDGSKKSATALNAALQYLEETEDTRVAMWFTEDNQRVVQERVKKMGKGKAKYLDRLDLIISEETKNRELIDTIIEEYDFIIFDPLTNFLEGDENSATEVGDLMKHLQIKASQEGNEKILILIHHTTKENASMESDSEYKVPTIRGSGGIKSASRLLYYIVNKGNDCRVYLAKDSYRVSTFPEREWQKIDPFNDDSMFNYNEEDDEMIDLDGGDF